MQPSQGSSIRTTACTDYRGNSIEVEAFPAAGAIKMRETASSRRSAEQEESRAQCAMFSPVKLDSKRASTMKSHIVRTLFCSNNILARRKVVSSAKYLRLSVITRNIVACTRVSSF